jgi:tetratricopeptide (TPR) repeat protein
MLKIGAFFLWALFFLNNSFAFEFQNKSKEENLTDILQIADELFKNNNNKIAETVYREYITDEKDFIKQGDANFFLSEIQYNNEQYKKAINNYLTILEQYPRTKNKYREEIYYKIAQSYFYLKNYSESIKYVNLLLSQFPKGHLLNDAYLLKAEDLFLLNEFDEALNILNILEQVNNYKYQDYVYYLQGRIYYEKIFAVEKKDKKEIADKSLSYFEKVKKEFPKTSILNYVYFREANVYYAMEEYPRAINIINELLKKEKDEKLQLVLKYFLAWNYYMVKNYDKALQIYSEIEKYENENIGIWAKYKKGLCYEGLNDEKNALLQYERVLKENENTIPAAYSEYALANYYFKKEEYAESLRLFNEIIEKYEVEELKRAAYFMSAEINIETQKYLTAKDIYAKIQEIYPEDKYTAKYLQAWCLSRAGEYTTAINIYDEILKDENSTTELKYKCQLKIGDNYYELDMLDEARKNYNEIIQKAKDFPDIQAEAFYSLGWIYYKKEDFQNAFLNFNKANQIANSQYLKLNSKFMMANTLYSNYKFDEALNYYQNIISDSKSDEKIKLESIFYSAFCYYRKGDFLTAINLWRQFENKTKDREKKAEALYRIGWAFFRQNKFPEALDTFNEITVKYRDTHYVQEAILKMGDCYYNMGQYEKAIEKYKELVDKYPQHYGVGDALYGVQWSYYQLGQYDKAIELSKQFIEKYKDSSFAPEIKYRIAEHYYNNGKYDIAIREFEEFIEKYPENELTDNAMYWSGICYFNLNQFNESINKLKDLIKKFPKSDFYDKAVFKIASAYYKLREFGAAIDYYKIIVEKLPDSKYIDDAYFNIAMSNKRLGNVEEAKKWYLKLIETGKNSKLVERGTMNLAYIYQDDKKYDDAINFFQKVINKNGDKAVEAQFWIADCYYSKGEKEKAAEEYLKVYKNFKNENLWVVTALDSAGKIYEEKNDLKKAISTYKKILTLKVDQKYIDYAKKKISLLEEQNRILNPVKEPAKKIKRY